MTGPVDISAEAIEKHVDRTSAALSRVRTNYLRTGAPSVIGRCETSLAMLLALRAAIDTAEATIAALTEANAALAQDNALMGKRVDERKFYHSEWPIVRLLEARKDGLVLDTGEAWRYSHTGMDGEGGKYDLLYRRNSDAPRATIGDA